MNDPYPHPVALLLTLGEELARMRQWPDYPASYGLDASHVPSLIRLATDSGLYTADGASKEVFAGLHAWRALGQLRAGAAVEPLLFLLHEMAEDDWALEELPRVFGMIGIPALTPLAEYLADPEGDLWTRVAAANGLREIAQRQGSAYDDAVDAIADQLGRYEASEPTLNACLIADLVELHAVEQAPLMERAFAAEAVDLEMMGDWEDVQVELGLLAQRTSPRPGFAPLLSPLLAPLLRSSFIPPEHTPPAPALAEHREREAKSKRKSRRKIAKDSRKRNRRKGK